MPAPRWVARMNRRVTNRVLGPLVTRLPGFATLIHEGRKTGKTYRTPLNVFRRPSGYVIALTYGPETEWVRNVLASGHCRIEMRGSVHELAQPRLIHDESRRPVPRLVRIPLRLMRVNDFLELSFADERGRES